MTTEQKVNFARYKSMYERAVTRMRQEPDRVAASGPSATVRVVKDRLFEARAREFTFMMDEPEERGGTNKFLSPMEYFAAGAAG